MYLEKKELHLIVTFNWYDMIESGKKTEEYRKSTSYFRKKLLHADYTHIRFRRGYTKTSMLFELDRINFGKGKEEWGAPEEACFILKLGQRIIND